MLLADTSAWVEYLRSTGSPVNLRMREALASDEIILTDPVLMEVMPGAAREQESKLLRLLGSQEYEPTAARIDWLEAAAIVTAGRRVGVTVRSSLDALIAAIAIRLDVPVLHADRDFTTISQISGLQIVAT